MYFESLQQVWQMDGHGIYVWTAYLVTLAIIAVIIVVPIRRRRRLLRQLSSELKRAAASAPAKGAS